MGKTNRLAALLMLLVLLEGAGCAHEPMPHVTIDLSTPKSAAVSYLRAMSAGDLDALKASTAGTDAQRKPAEAYAAMISGMRRYDKAIVTHFGNDAMRDDVELRQKLTELSDDRIERTQQGSVQETETQAMVSPGLNGMALKKRPPIMLVKDKGFWKVDLAQTAVRDTSLSPESRERNQAVGDALLKLARDIERGRYKTYEQMQRDADAGMP